MDNSTTPTEATLHIVTPHTQPPAPLAAIAMPETKCVGSMTCDCTNCTAELQARVARGVRRYPQPWDKAA